MERELSNFIKYCLGYVSLTRQRVVLNQKRLSVDLPSEIFNLIGLLNGDEDGSLAELINLKTFYGYDPRNVSDEDREVYEKEKELAQKIDEIYSKYRNDPYTKQAILNFGFFEIEIPLDMDGDVVVVNEQDEEREVAEIKTKIDRYPLFSLPIRIEKETDASTGAGKYLVSSRI